MAKIHLSRTNAEYTLAVGGWTKSDTALDLVVIASDEPLDEVEEIFKDNDLIKMTDASLISNAYNYKTVQAIGKEYNDEAGGVDENGEPLLSTVWRINLTKPSLEDRVSANEDAIATSEDAIAELAEIIGGAIDG